jgi:trehalose 2-sulfotransferase
VNAVLESRFANEPPDRYSPRAAIRALRAAQLTRPVSPTRSLIVATNPRAGSWMLCTGLAKTGLAGYPSEYLIPWDERDWARLWGTSGYRAFLDAMLLEGTSPNGVFAAKIMWRHVGHLVDRAAEIPGYGNSTAPDLMAAVFPEAHYVWLRRRDVYAQAVSHARALLTDVWAVGTDDLGAGRAEQAECDFDLVAKLRDELAEDERGWGRFFAESGVEPVTLWYEDLVDDYAGAVGAVLGHVGADVADALEMPRPDVCRQADPVSARWVRECRERFEGTSR